MTARMADRRADLARIHILKKELALQDDEYRDLLFTVARVRSSADLDHSGRAAVIAHLSALAEKYRPNEWAFVDRAAADRQQMLRKICAMCRSHRPRRSKNYVDSMAETMFGLSALEFAAPDQLHKIVSALVIDAGRRAAKASA